MTALATEMKAERADSAKTYVRKDVYAEAHASLRGDITDLQGDEKIRDQRAADTRRQLLVGLALLAIPALFSLVLAINNYLASGGATP